MAKRKPKNHYGEGSIFYSNVKQKWMAQIDVGKDENGKVIRKSVTADTQEEVKAKLDELKLSIYTGKFVNANTITFHNSLNLYICTVYCTLNNVMALYFFYEYAIIVI